MDQLDHVTDGTHDQEAHPDGLAYFEEFAAVRCWERLGMSSELLSRDGWKSRVANGGDQ